MNEIMQECCDVCGEEFVGKLYGNSRGFEILSCERCNLIWTNPLKLPRIPSAPFSKVEKVYLTNAPSQRKRFINQLKILLSFVGLKDPKCLKVLDVGCGYGFFLDACEEFGIIAEGCDTSEVRITYANKNQNRQRARLGTLDSFYEGETYDVICAFNLLEHLTSPKAFFLEAKRVLKPGGYLFSKHLFKIAFSIL